MEGNYEIWNDYYVHESKVDEKQTNSSNKSEELSKVKVHAMDSIDLFLT